MKLPKNYLENLSTNKYREYLKLLPASKNENAHAFVALALTFAALSFFGIFAINPVLSTVVDLKKQLADSKFVDEQLGIKITNLSLLQQKYTNFPQSDFQTIYSAIPQEPSVPALMGQIQAVSEKSKLTLSSLRVSEVQLVSNKQLAPASASFAFSLDAKGAYEDMLTFSSNLIKFNRIITIDSLSISKDIRKESLILTLRGRSYFKKD